jgi:hypothetical protein
MKRRRDMTWRPVPCALRAYRRRDRELCSAIVVCLQAAWLPIVMAVGANQSAASDQAERPPGVVVAASCLRPQSVRVVPAVSHVDFPLCRFPKNGSCACAC